MKENFDSKKVLIVFLIMLGLTLITGGISYAFYSYSKTGSTESTITSGKVTLHYSEESMAGISLLEMFPMSDTQGKQQQYFEFKITSDTTSFQIPYIITARMQGSAANRIPEEYITVYLTEVNNGVETEKVLAKYSELTNVSKNNHIEQQLFATSVPTNTSNYEKTYRLRMWLNTDANFSPIEENGVQTYPLNNKTFEIKVDVYTDVEAAPTVCTAVFNNETGGPLAVGSEVSIGSEHFIVTDTNADTTTLLSKYKLVPIGYATPENSVEGLQSDYSSMSGQVPFSKQNYWAGNSDLTNIYDNTKTGAPVFTDDKCDVDDGWACAIYSIKENETPDNYSVAYYVERYANTIRGMGATINDSRLLLKSEIEDLTGVYYIDIELDSGCMWLGTAANDDEVYA